MSEDVITFLLENGLSLVCCDCGLVHRISGLESPVKVTYSRDSVKTNNERIKNGKSIMLVMDQIVGFIYTSKAVYTDSKLEADRSGDLVSGEGGTPRRPLQNEDAPRPREPQRGIVTGTATGCRSRPPL